MSTVTATADLLDKAAQIIEANGWLQDDYYDFTESQVMQKQPKECRVCAYGALNIAATGAPSPHAVDEEVDVVEDAADAVTSVLGIEGLDLAAWNDVPGRTAQEVIDGMRTTAAALREQVTR